MSWTDERVELLRKLWLEGLSASQIAAELSSGITRNAVIGKVHRLGLSGRAKAPAAVAARPRLNKPTAPIVRHQHQPHHSAPSRPSAPVSRGATALAYQPVVLAVVDTRPREDVVIPISERVTIMELKEAMCRWPLGDPTTAEFRFCGSKSPVGVSYCAYHAGIAYQPAHDRRRERDRERRLLKAG
jgi:GcrA cell cycle regulator